MAMVIFCTRNRGFRNHPCCNQLKNPPHMLLCQECGYTNGPVGLARKEPDFSRPLYVTRHWLWTVVKYKITRISHLLPLRRAATYCNALCLEPKHNDQYRHAYGDHWDYDSDGNPQQQRQPIYGDGDDVDAPPELHASSRRWEPNRLTNTTIPSKTTKYDSTRIFL